MTIKINAQGQERKRLVTCISDWMGIPAKYCGAPTFSYEVDYIKVDKNGSLEFDDRADSEVIERLLQHIYDEGFDIDQSDTEGEEEETALTVSIPLEKVRLGNLLNLLDSKESLIKKALGVDDIRIKVEDETVEFPWFSKMPDADTAKAYTEFISKLCEMSYKQNRITAKEKPVENEKYAFRCFLLRLGFIGDEYKGSRKILLSKLSGNTAFKDGGNKDEISK